MNRGRGRPRKTAVYVPDDATALETVTAPADEPQDAVDRVAEMLAASRSEHARVRVDRVKEDGTFGFCKTYQPDEFERGGSLDLIRREFGAGRFKIQLFATDPQSGKFTGYNKATVEIEAIRAPETSPADAFAAAIDRIEKLVAARAPEPAQNPFGQFKEMMGLAVLIREAFGIKQAEPLNPVAQLGQLITLLKGGQELAATLNPPPEPPDALSAIAPKAIEIIGDALKGQAGHARGTLAPVALPPSIQSAPVASPPQGAAVNDGFPNGAAAPIHTPIEGDTMNREELNVMRQILRALNVFAHMETDPETAADLIFEKMPNDALPWLESPSWFDQMVLIESGVRPYRAWYDKVRGHLLEFFKEQTDAPADGPRAAA